MIKLFFKKAREVIIKIYNIITFVEIEEFITETEHTEGFLGFLAKSPS